MIIALGMFAMTAGCSSIGTVGGDAPIVTQKSAPPYASAACFYSDKSGADRIVGGPGRPLVRSEAASGVLRDRGSEPQE